MNKHLFISIIVLYIIVLIMYSLSPKPVILHG